ncbi:MAG TPA: SDR family oxidoreductase [Thermomicrobiales bacterium]|jgi:NAD(P)-dependent dehydrogenase (short-subunit alcohol dehydrogenase family)
MIDFGKRVVLVTGAAGAIGSAIARTLAGVNGRVLVHDLQADAVARLVGELGDAAFGLTADLGDPAATAALWDEALQIHGRIDVLVNNAGIYPPAPLDLAPADWVGVWDRSLAVNLTAPAILCRAAVLAFSAQPEGGIIVNMASRAAFRGEDPDYWHYAAAKAGLVAMTRTIARQYGRRGVTAFAIAPGYVDTPFNQAFADEFGVETAAAQTGLGEVAQPQDVANVVAFLCSGLARHATGTTIDVNGASYVR